MPFWNAEMASFAPGSLVQCLEKHWMYSHRLSLGFCLQFHSSHYLPGRVYVPWKLPMNTRHRSAQSWISP
jgi:hypothetical protein